jgi:ATP-dependent Clp protease ATP-binding subunit ClpC
MGSEHLLLGILRAGDGLAAAALRANGVTLDGARAAAQPTLATDEPPTDERASVVTTYARHVFNEALREAAADRAHVIGVADLLRSALRDPSGGACRTLDALGVSVEGVLAAVSR